MLLTKDNLLKFVVSNKFVTPTTVASFFETTTMIASATLSELAKNKLISISHLKIGSTPYYYNQKEKECLIELGEKHFKDYEKEVFLKLKNSQILNDNSLSIQERLSIEKIVDFRTLVVIEKEGKTYKFWIWYLRNIDETKSQINFALSKKNESEKKPLKKSENNSEKNNSQSFRKSINEKIETNKEANKNLNSFSNSNQMPLMQGTQKIFKPQIKTSNGKDEQISTFIDNFIQTNYLKILEKEKNSQGIFQKASILVNEIEIIFDIQYFEKKPKDLELIQFYTSSQNPKIALIPNTPTKFFKIARGLENLTIINI